MILKKEEMRALNKLVQKTKLDDKDEYHIGKDDETMVLYKVDPETGGTYSNSRGADT